jgi:hypothetical protein
MSIDIKLDPMTHDLALSKTNDLVLIDGAERIAQQIKVTLLTFFGEWFLDTTFGVPYLEIILIKNPNRAEIENIIRQKVRAVPGVFAVPTVQIEIEAETRRGRITLPDIDTKEGRLTVQALTPNP